MNGALPNEKPSFLNFNIGHVLTIAVVAGGWVYNYATNSTRIESLEKNLVLIQSDRALSRPIFDNMRVEMSTDAATLAQHDRELGELRTSIIAIGVDVAAIKTQIAVIGNNIGVRFLPPPK